MAIKKENINKKLEENKSKKSFFKQWEVSEKNAIKLESLGFDPSQKMYFWQDIIMTLFINPKKMKINEYNLILLTNTGKLRFIPKVNAGKFYYKDNYNGEERELDAELTESRLYHYNNRRFWVLVSGSKFPEKLDNKIDSRKVTDMVISIDNENKELKLALEKEKNKGIMNKAEFWIMIAIAIAIVWSVMSGTIDLSSLFSKAGEVGVPKATEVTQNLSTQLN